MKAVKAKAAAPPPKAKGVEDEAKVEALELHLAKEGGGTRPQRRLLHPRPSPKPTRQAERQELHETFHSFPRRMQPLWHLWPPRDCRKPIYAESKKTKRQTNNSVTATQVTFDADKNDLTGSEPDDETATLFQSGLTIDSDNEAQDSVATKIKQGQTTKQMTTKNESTIPSLLTAFATSTIASSFRPMVLQPP
jgi:hypothetical protein